MEIAATIYEKSADGLMTQLKKFSPYLQYFQIDISDGVYAPNKTISIKDALITIARFTKNNNQKLFFDFHLMVGDYQTAIDELLLSKNIYLKNLLVHYSLKPPINYLLSLNHGFGLVLNRHDSVADFTKNYDLAKIPVIQLMTIDIGAQGNPFLADNLKKIAELRQKGFRGKIFIDGSVNKETIPYILSQQYKPDVLCVGSYLVGADSVELPTRINYLKSL